jgi:hypothetical protein
VKGGGKAAPTILDDPAQSLRAREAEAKCDHVWILEARTLSTASPATMRDVRCRDRMEPRCRERGTLKCELRAGGGTWDKACADCAGTWQAHPAPKDVQPAMLRIQVQVFHQAAFLGLKCTDGPLFDSQFSRLEAFDFAARFSLFLRFSIFLRFSLGSGYHRLIGMLPISTSGGPTTTRTPVSGGVRRCPFSSRRFHPNSIWRNPPGLPLPRLGSRSYSPGQPSQIGGSRIERGQSAGGYSDHPLIRLACDSWQPGDQQHTSGSRRQARQHQLQIIRAVSLR